MIVILGPSSSRKSTLLNILGGIETATSGEVLYQETLFDWNDKKALSEYRRAHVGLPIIRIWQGWRAGCFHLKTDT